MSSETFHSILLISKATCRRNFMEILEWSQMCLTIFNGLVMWGLKFWTADGATIIRKPSCVFLSFSSPCQLSHSAAWNFSFRSVLANPCRWNQSWRGKKRNGLPIHTWSITFVNGSISANVGVEIGLWVGVMASSSSSPTSM